MSGFKALNIESDDESDIEVDDTKELQIEDALKLYQNALKYHAEGPGSFDRAAEAYEELFQSDIFKYPESQTELRRIELFGPSSEPETYWSNEYVSEVTITPAGLDTGPSSLPQILNLSHKNYAQFKLDYLGAKMQTFNVTLAQVLRDATKALDHFVEALDKDDTDLDLWRRTADVGNILETHRTARFCLEAVLDGDEEGLDGLLSLPGLEQSLAGEQLRSLISILGDELSSLQMPSSTSQKRTLSKILKQRMNPYAEITKRKRFLKEQGQPSGLRRPKKITLTTPRTWAELGETLLLQAIAEQHGTSPPDADSAICFELGSTATPSAQVVGQRDESNDANIEPRRVCEGPDGQSPGRDNGQHIVQPEAAATAAHVEPIARPQDHDGTAPGEIATVALPTRKRSGDAAGLQDAVEEGRTKSKRTRTRDSTTAEESRQAMRDANIRWEFEQQLNEIQAADDWMFETVGNLFERIGIVGFDAARNVRQELQTSDLDDRVSLEQNDTGTNQGLRLAKLELQDFLNNFSDDTAHELLNGDESIDVAQRLDASGFSASRSTGTALKTVAHKPSLMPEDGLLTLLQNVNDGWMTTEEVAWRWLTALLRPQTEVAGSNTYCDYQWTEELKTMVVRNLVTFNESIFKQAARDVARWRIDTDVMNLDDGLAEMIETIFELQLDIYCLIKEANSGVDRETIITQGHRLSRWSALGQEVLNLRAAAEPSLSTERDSLCIRYLWAMTFQLGAEGETSQEHVMECMNDLRALMVATDGLTIQLQNNAIMPEISVSALDREISRLTTKDFFLKVTSQDLSDPVAVIESLEPILLILGDPAESPEEIVDTQDKALPPAVSPELLRFLRGSELSVRMRLWQHLRDAYLAIDYKPMVILCYFKMVHVLMTELDTKLPDAHTGHDRQVFVLKVMRLIHSMTGKALKLIQSSENAFECVDEDCLKTTVTTFGQVLQLLQIFNVFEDHIRVGQNQPPSASHGTTVLSYAAATSVAHELQVNIWITLYSLLKEANFQFHDAFPTPIEDMFDFLRTVHRNLGLRSICGVSNRVFVRMLKDEFLQMTHVEGYDSEQAQVLYDLHGLNCFLNPSYELMDHHCVHDAFLDRGVALQAVDLLLQQASKLQIKELVKHSLKDTIDKVHGAAPRKKPTEAIMRNRDVCRAFLRSPINPLALYQCLDGSGSELAVTYVPKSDASLASKGWYFLMGHIALAKFRSQKRTGPTPTEDVDIAIAFFMQDLEYSVTNWETWFRLAQAYDTKIEESVVWSAERLNNNMPEIVQLQRAAIHCFTTATALAYRSADLRFETSEKMTELLSDFAMRMYTSSREPFGMRAFQLDEDEKFLSFAHGVAKGKAFQPLRAHTAWKLAKVMFQRALAGNPQSWTLQYAIGKCLWKMRSISEAPRVAGVSPTTSQVIATFVRAIELLPNKKDSREKREPILEPHYKLVSIVHKLYSTGEINLAQAREVLSNTCYAQTDEFPEERAAWVPYVVSVLKKLRAADKSNWHHRMIARIANIAYDHPPPQEGDHGPHEHAGAIAAKHELTQQMFTKTMVLQVWRPESERPGRHFVYTARYTRFFVRILEELDDRVNLEQLARRVRRRPHDLFEHSQVWQDICTAYLRQLRAYGHLPDGLETSTFSNIIHEDFLARKDLLEEWMQSQETGVSQPLDVLRDVQELKKINQSLMKPGPIDDLIGDSYAYLFNTEGRRLLEDERRLKLEEESQRPLPVVSPPRNPTMSLTHLMNIDGTNDATAPPASQPTAPAPQPEQAPARRKVGVGRREIRACAEACFQKVVSSGINTAPLIKTTGPSPRVQVVIEMGRRPSASGITSLETSAPGSIHDSADDESELSSLEEDGDEEAHADDAIKTEERPRPLFPGLLSNMGSRATSEGFETVDEELDPIDEDTEAPEQTVKADAVGEGEQEKDGGLE